MALMANRWVEFRLQAIWPFTVIEITDDAGRPPRVLTLPGMEPFRPTMMPGASPLLREIAQRTTAERSVLTGRVPIFLSAAASLPPVDLTALFGPVVAGLPVVEASRAPEQALPPFALPLKFAAIGKDARQWITRLMGHHWSTDEAVREFGLQVHTAERDVAAIVAALAPQVVVTDRPDEAVAAAGRLPHQTRTRLIVWIDDTLGSEAPAIRLVDAPGVAVLRIGITSTDDAARAIETFGFEFTHDRPLHELAGEIARQTGTQVRLTADRASLHGLRLSEAVRAMRRDGQRLEARWPNAGRESTVAQWLSNARTAPNFLHESGAFVPLARALAQRDAAHAAFRSAMAARRRAPPQAVPEQRAVHVALERLEGGNYLQPMERTTTLGAGLAYQLRVHIGMALPDSLVENPQPIEPSLGPPDDDGGYQLEVAVQGRDFAVLSESTLPLFLPKSGGSEPLYFDVRAPQQQGPAQLRICLYHRNNLVQSHVLSGVVGPYETSGAEDVLTVKCELSFVDRIDHADQLAPRALSLGVNDAADGRHHIVIKATNVSQEVALAATTFEATSDEIRKVLAVAATDPTNPIAARIYPKIQRGDPTPLDVATTIRTLAEWGNRLYSAFFDRVALPGSVLRKELVRLLSGPTESIQIVRFRYEDVFLWTLLYDWDLPANRSADVCLGWKRDAGGNPVECGHTSCSGLFCVRGFWGVRHRVEERIDEPGGGVSTITAAANGRPVRVVADTALPGAATLAVDLAGALGAANVDTGPGVITDLLDLLFDKDKRPTLLIILGHHDQQFGTPPTARIQLDGTPTWLSEDDLRSRAKRSADAWEQPRSLVLLMGCDSATTKLATLTNFVTAWCSVGASAIVGTEAVVGSTTAADFARRFSERAFKQKQSFGTAMNGIRRELLAEGNPLAFVFHAIGNVDLTLN
ncbi:MAG: hypothetical protein ABIS29_05580 [Vicinamibacterales bacterium]